MNTVTFYLDPDYGNYSYQNASNVELCILGLFFSDIGCSKQSSPTYQEWMLYDKWGTAVGTNATFLEKDGDYIFLTEHFSEEEKSTQLKIFRQQFVQLLNEWQGKVCKTKPSKVIITHENDEFIIETTD